MTKTELLALKPDLHPVDVPGGKVFVRCPAFGRFVECQSRVKENPADELVLTVLYFTCDEGGEPLFDVCDLDAVKHLPLPVLGSINKAAMGVMGLNVEDEKKG